jgi:catechol 2,3-dioxygenase-like lactoylglutathione lyase family enzyme
VTSRFSEVVVDAHDPEKLAAFWCEVLGYRVLETTEDLFEIGPGELTADDVRAAPVPPSIVFVRVVEPKLGKNRTHIDVNPIDARQEEEVERLLTLGAKHVDIGQGDQSWVVLADPEGNEFCVLRSLAG